MACVASHLSLNMYPPPSDHRHPKWPPTAGTESRFAQRITQYVPTPSPLSAHESLFGGKFNFRLTGETGSASVSNNIYTNRRQLTCRRPAVRQANPMEPVDTHRFNHHRRPFLTIRRTIPCFSCPWGIRATVRDRWGTSVVPVLHQQRGCEVLVFLPIAASHRQCACICQRPTILRIMEHTLPEFRMPPHSMELACLLSMTMLLK